MAEQGSKPRYATLKDHSRRSHISQRRHTNLVSGNEARCREARVWMFYQGRQHKYHNFQVSLDEISFHCFLSHFAEALSISTIFLWKIAQSPLICAILPIKVECSSNNFGIGERDSTPRATVKLRAYTKDGSRLFVMPQFGRDYITHLFE